MVVVDHEDYPAVLEFLRREQDDQEFRRKLAWKAFQHVATYDSAVSEWLWKQTENGKASLSLVFGSYNLIIKLSKLLFDIVFFRRKASTQLYGTTLTQKYTSIW